MRYITLEEEQREELENLYNTSSSSVIRKRCFCLLLSNKSNSMATISRIMNISSRTISRLLDKWDAATADNKLSSLYSTEGQGAKVKLEPVAGSFFKPKFQ